MADAIEPSDGAAVAEAAALRQPVFRFALTDVVVIGAAVSITAVLCWLAYVFPKSGVDPAAGATILADASTSELLKLPRTVQACQELLQRSDVDSETLHAALIRLARLQHKTTAESLLELTNAVDASTSERRLRNLTRLAEVVRDKDDLRDRIEALTKTGDNRQTRQVATAILISINGNADALFAATSRNTEQLSELLQALPLVHSAELQARVYDKVRQFLLDKDEARLELKKTAMVVMVDLQGREEIKALDLIRLVEIKGLQNAAIDGFSKLPMQAWPRGELGQFAARITSWIAYHSPADRRTPELQTAMSLAQRISELFTGEERQRLVDRLTQLRVESD